MDLSVVIPMFNEAENARATLNQVEEAMVSFQGTYEIVAVNDGSTDDTLLELKRAAEKNGRVEIVTYSKNFGREGH